MRGYVTSSLVGLGVMSFILVLNAVSYFGIPKLFFILLLGTLQGTIVSVVYRDAWHIPYLLKFLVHAILSYLLVLSLYLFAHVAVNIIIVTFEWLIVFAIVFAYFYYSNRKDAEELNRKLREYKRTR